MKQQDSILLAEDDRVDVMAIQRAFRLNKITNPLYVVSNGEEALAFLRHEGDYADAKTSPRPGLILLDLNMPRMNGLEFLDIVKNDPEIREIPVVVFTSSIEEADIKASFRNGVAGYLVKPVTFEKLVQAISTFDLYWTLSKLP